MKRTELKRKTPLRTRHVPPKQKHEPPKQRSTPPKQREPMKRSRKAAKPIRIKVHLNRVAAMPCIICKKPGPSTVHHVRHKVTRSGTFARDDRRVVPLCPAHHLIQHGPHESVEALHEAGIFERFGVDLWAEAEGLWHGSEAWANGVEANLAR